MALSTAILAFLAPAGPCFASGEGAFGIKVLSYSGQSTSDLVPAFGFGGDFSASYFLSRSLHLVNHFGFDAMVGGTNFKDQWGPYTGYSATYAMTFKSVFAPQARIQPYLEFGPTLGLFVVLVNGIPDGYAQDQVALKGGFIIGFGADWMRINPSADEVRGEVPGWGLGVSYFDYVAGPQSLDFSSGKQAVKGIIIQVRFIWGSSKPGGTQSTGSSVPGT